MTKFRVAELGFRVKIVHNLSTYESTRLRCRLGSQRLIQAEARKVQECLHSHEAAMRDKDDSMHECGAIRACSMANAS